MRENGLQYSEIDFYSAEDNYGLTQEDFDLWFGNFIPAHQDKNQWIQNPIPDDKMKRDAAEILHILRAKSRGENVVNTSFGGQTTSWRFILSDRTNVVKLLTRQTSVDDALRLINMSETSIVNLYNVFNKAQALILTDQWKTIQLEQTTTLSSEELTLLPLSWSEFCKKYVKDFIIHSFYSDGHRLKMEWKPEDVQTLKRFFEAKYKYLQEILPITGDKRTLTEAHKKLLRANIQHLFTAKFSTEKLTEYMMRVMQASLETFTGNQYRHVNVEKVSKATIVSVSGMFDIGNLHKQGGTITDYIRNLPLSNCQKMSENLKRQYMVQTFQYLYNKTKKENFAPNTYYEYAVEDEQIIKHSHEGMGFPVVSMTSNYIGNDERLYVKVHNTFRSAGLTFADTNWLLFFKEMMTIYREFNNIPDLAEFEDNHGNIIYGTRGGLEEQPWLYFNDVYEDIISSLEQIDIY